MLWFHLILQARWKMKTYLLIICFSSFYVDLKRVALCFIMGCSSGTPTFVLEMPKNTQLCQCLFSCIHGRQTVNEIVYLESRNPEQF